MESFSSFADLGLHPDLSRALQKIDFVSPTPIQQQAIPHGLKGRDILGCAQTGTGKTAAFVIPVVAHILANQDSNALILAPTRELADQIYKVCRQMTAGTYIKSVLIVGGAAIFNQIRDLRSGVDIVIATPGRLIDLMQQRKINFSEVQMFVLDEVDRMLDMGFIPQIKQIVEDLPEKRQTMLFSATLPREILALANSFLNDPVKITVGEESKPSLNIEQKMIEITQDQKNDHLLKEVGENQGKLLVFARTQHRAERVAQMLYQGGHSVATLHGGRTHGQRKKALENFRSGQSRILVATDLAGRGIDVLDIEKVINFDMPDTEENYIHRIGRTGRNGTSGIALSYVTSEDIFLARKLFPGTFPNHANARPFNHRRPSRGGRPFSSGRNSGGQNSPGRSFGGSGGGNRSGGGYGNGGAPQGDRPQGRPFRGDRSDRGPERGDRPARSGNGGGGYGARNSSPGGRGGQSTWQPRRER